MYVTILAIKRHYEKAQKLKEGDIVELIKEPDNAHDSDALKVVWKGEMVGYVANNEKTVLEGTLSATEIHSKIKDGVKVKLLKLENDEGNFMNVFKGEIIKEKKKAKKKEIEFSLIGGFATYHGKKDLISDIENGGNRIVKLFKGEDNIFVEYNGKIAGKVSATEEVNEILEECLEDLPEVIATANGIDKGNILCSLEVKASVSKRKTNIKGEIERIVKEGINTQEEIERKLDYLKKSKVSKVNIELIFKSYEKYPKEVASRIPKKPDVLFVDTEGLVATSIFYINAKKNLIFEGEKGVGKNVLTETLAWIYNRPLYEFSSNSQHSNSSLLGGQTFVEKTKKGKSKQNKVIARLLGTFVKRDNDTTDEEIKALEGLIDGFNRNNKELVFEMSSILEAFKNGGILVLDEFNTSLAHVMPIFNALLDDRRRMEVTGLGQIKGHPNFCAIATQNKDYQGTFESNEATADRFEPIIFPQSTTIVNILKERVPEIGYDTLTIADELYQGIKSAVEIGEIGQGALSIRGFISACEVISLGMDTKTAFITSVAHRASDLEERRAIENMIDLLIE